MFFVVDQWRDDDKNLDHFNQLCILHNDSTFAFYAHLKANSLLVRAGDTVTQGQVIAANGESGTETMCEFGQCGLLHFGVFKESWAVNLPVVFNNAQGPLDSRGGLRAETTYLALPEGG